MISLTGSQLTREDISIRSHVCMGVAEASCNKSSAIALQVWDTAGQEAFRKVVTSIYRNVKAVLVVFDPHDRASFDSARSLWMPEAKEFAAADTVKMLVSSNASETERIYLSMQVQQVGP